MKTNKKNDIIVREMNKMDENPLIKKLAHAKTQL